MNQQSATPTSSSNQEAVSDRGKITDPRQKRGSNMKSNNNTKHKSRHKTRGNRRARGRGSYRARGTRRQTRPSPRQPSTTMTLDPKIRLLNSKSYAYESSDKLRANIGAVVSISPVLTPSLCHLTDLLSQTGTFQQCFKSLKAGRGPDSFAWPRSGRQISIVVSKDTPIFLTFRRAIPLLYSVQVSYDTMVGLKTLVARPRPIFRGTTPQGDPCIFKLQLVSGNLRLPMLVLRLIFEISSQFAKSINEMTTGAIRTRLRPNEFAHLVSASLRHLVDLSICHSRPSPNVTLAHLRTAIVSSLYEGNCIICDYEMNPTLPCVTRLKMCPKTQAILTSPVSAVTAIFDTYVYDRHFLNGPAIGIAPDSLWTKLTAWKTKLTAHVEIDLPVHRRKLLRSLNVDSAHTTHHISQQYSHPHVHCWPKNLNPSAQLWRGLTVYDIHAIRDVFFAITKLGISYAAKNVCDIPINLSLTALMTSSRITSLASAVFYHGVRLDPTVPAQRQHLESINQLFGRSYDRCTIPLDTLICQIIGSLQIPPCSISASLAGQLCVPESILSMMRTEQWSVDYAFIKSCDCTTSPLMTTPIFTLPPRETSSSIYVDLPVSDSYLSVDCGYPSVEHTVDRDHPISNEYHSLIEPLSIKLAFDSRTLQFSRDTCDLTKTSILMSSEFQFFKGVPPGPGIILIGPCKPALIDTFLAILSSAISVQKLFVWGLGALLLRTSAPITDLASPVTKRSLKEAQALVNHLELAFSSLGNKIYTVDTFVAVLSLLPSLTSGDSIRWKHSTPHQSREGAQLNCFENVVFRHTHSGSLGSSVQRVSWTLFVFFKRAAFRKLFKNDQIGLLSEDHALMHRGRPRRLASLLSPQPRLCYMMKGNARRVNKSRSVWLVGAGSGIILRRLAWLVASKLCKPIAIVAPSYFEVVAAEKDSHLIYPKRLIRNASIRYSETKVSQGAIGTDSNVTSCSVIVAVEVLPSLEWKESPISPCEEYYLKLLYTARLSEAKTVWIIFSAPFATTTFAGRCFNCSYQSVYLSEDPVLTYCDSTEFSRHEVCLNDEILASVALLLNVEGITAHFTVHSADRHFNSDTIKMYVAESKNRVDSPFIEETNKILHHRRIILCEMIMPEH